MYRNWKNAAALGLAALLGCMAPVSTMLAAEDAEIEAGLAADNGAAYEDENISDSGNAIDVEMETETVSAEENKAAGVLSIPAAENDAETKEAEDAGSVSAPEIIITINGKNITSSLGGKIAFEYIGSWGPEFKFSVGQSDNTVSFFYYLETLTDIEAEAKTEAQMDSLGWIQGDLSKSIMLLQDGKYVIYVKAETGGKSYYARSEGVVADTQKPVIKGVEEGKTYPEGTLFQVEDANLDYVLVNEQAVTPENGNYKVAANGTSCMIRAKDKAGHETACSITVSGSVTPEPETPEPETPEPETPEPETPEPEAPEPEKPEPPVESNIISKSGEYALKAGVKYHLAEGKWKVDGDKSVYSGGKDFYVKADGSYKFKK